MFINSKLLDDTLYIEFVGELDESTANYTRKILDEKLHMYKFSNLIFEMENLEFMDSTGIGVLLGRYKKLKQKNKNIYISNPSKTIEKIFKMSGIFEIMPKIY